MTIELTTFREAYQAMEAGCKFYQQMYYSDLYHARENGDMINLELHRDETHLECRTGPSPDFGARDFLNLDHFKSWMENHGQSMGNLVRSAYLDAYVLPTKSTHD